MACGRCPADSSSRGNAFIPRAVRELAEETGYKPHPAQLRTALKSSAVFDHPARSPRGRIITNAFHFDLGDAEFPDVQGSDDAKLAKWVPLAQLPSLESQLFEDHACILDHFVGLYPPPDAIDCVTFQSATAAVASSYSCALNRLNGSSIMSLRIGDKAPDFQAQTTQGRHQLSRLARQFLGHSVFASQGFHARVHHGAGLPGEARARVRQAQHEDPGPVGRSSDGSRALAQRHQGCRRRRGELSADRRS